jgi:Predicted transcriptional regulators
MNERLKHLRNELKLNQKEFGKKVGVSNTAISKLEKAERNITEQMIISICREFNVNEQWLRYGKGPVFLDLPQEDQYFKAVTELSRDNDSFAMQAIIEYWKLDDSRKETIRNFIIGISKNVTP